MLQDQEDNYAGQPGPSENNVLEVTDEECESVASHLLRLDNLLRMRVPFGSGVADLGDDIPPEFCQGGFADLPGECYLVTDV